MEAKIFPIGSKCSVCAAQKAGICDVSDPAISRELERISWFRNFSQGQCIQHEGAQASLVGIVISGVVKLQRTLEDGRQQIVGIHTSSELFGLVMSHQSHFGIEAATDVTICCFERNAFEGLISRHKELEHNVMTAALRELDFSREWMIILGCLNATERIAGFLALLLEKKADGCWQQSCAKDARIVLPVKRSDLAAYLATTVETLSRTFRKFERDGLIRKIDHSNFEILDQRALARLSGRRLQDIDSAGRQAQKPGTAHHSSSFERKLALSFADIDAAGNRRWL
jgi:CRP/FNR family transcriptional regulator